MPTHTRHFHYYYSELRGSVESSFAGLTEFVFALAATVSNAASSLPRGFLKASFGTWLRMLGKNINKVATKGLTVVSRVA